MQFADHHLTLAHTGCGCAAVSCCVLLTCVLLRAQSEIFLFVLLPTIMFDAGYSLDATP